MDKSFFLDLIFPPKIRTYLTLMLLLEFESIKEFNPLNYTKPNPQLKLHFQIFKFSNCSIFKLTQSIIRKL